MDVIFACLCLCVKNWNSWNQKVIFDIKNIFDIINRFDISLNTSKISKQRKNIASIYKHMDNVVYMSIHIYNTLFD